MQSEENNKEYIAYLDFVGTKGIAFVSNDAYSKNVITILEHTQALSNKYSTVSITMLSDSVFLTSTSKEIFDFLRDFRNMLFYESIFFTCVVIMGKHGLLKSNDKKFTYYVFNETATIKAYAKQAALKGISIDVSEIVILNSESCEVVESFYLRNNELIKIYDIDYYNNSTEYKDLYSFYYDKLSCIFKECYQQSIINAGAAKYYLTPFISILNSAFKHNDNNEPSTAKRLFQDAIKLFNMPYLKESDILINIFAFLVNCILEYNDNYYVDIVFVKEISTNAFFINLVKRLNYIPNELLSNKHKRELLNIYYVVMGNTKKDDKATQAE